MFRMNGRCKIDCRYTLLPNLIVALALLAASGPGGMAIASERVLAKDTPVQVYFSPRGGAIDGIVRAVAKARSEVLVQAHTLLSPAITRSLLDAWQRGVKVAVILDRSERQEGLTPAVRLANAGVPVYLDGKHAAANDRVIVIDGRTVVTGSLNFTTASDELNGENLLVIHSPELAALYAENWQRHREHAEPY
jgi:phosphatidylserine/phosphatidylglycerophosphate/cardiolipin synthase-like enzyme